MTLAQFPESKFWDFCWIFCPEMTLAQFPEFGFFVQNSRIGVKYIPNCKRGDFNSAFLGGARDIQSAGLRQFDPQNWVDLGIELVSSFRILMIETFSS